MIVWGLLQNFTIRVKLGFYKYYKLHVALYLLVKVYYVNAIFVNIIIIFKIYIHFGMIFLPA